MQGAVPSGNQGPDNRKNRLAEGWGADTHPPTELLLPTRKPKSATPGPAPAGISAMSTMIPLMPRVYPV